MSESKWSNKQLLLEAESIVVGRYGIDATYKALQTMRDDMQATIDDLRAQLAFKEGLIRQLTEVDMPALEQQLAKAIESNDGLRAEFVRVAMQKGIAESQLATLQAAKPVALDAPDGPGWWAFEGNIRCITEVTHFEIMDDDLVRIEFSDWESGPQLVGIKYFREMNPGKWTRLHMPWDATPVADPDARTVWPDWSQAPEWAEWWAIDKDGTAKWFGTKPEMWGAIGWICDHITAVDRYTKHPWQSSLQRRPHAQQDSQEVQP